MFNLDNSEIHYKDWYSLKWGTPAEQRMYENGETKFLHATENNLPVPVMYEGQKVVKLTAIPAIDTETGKRYRGKRVLSLLSSKTGVSYPQYQPEERKVADAVVDMKTWRRFSSAPVWNGMTGWNKAELEKLLLEVFGEDNSDLEVVTDSPEELGHRNVKIVFYPASDAISAYANLKYLITANGAVRTPESLNTNEAAYVIEALNEPHVWESKRMVKRMEAEAWDKEAEAWYEGRRKSEQDAENCSFLELMRH